MLHVTRHMGGVGGGLPCYMLHGYMGGWWGIFAPLHVTWGVGGGSRVTVTWNCVFFLIVTGYEFRSVRV